MSIVWTGTDRIGHRALGVLADLERRRDGRFEVPYVVHRVEYAEDIHPVLGGRLDKGFDDVVGVVAVTEDVLGAEQHLHPGLGHRSPNQSQPLPRILSEKPDARVERRTAPHLGRPKTDLVQPIAYGQHVVDSHARREQRLVRVAKYEFGNAEWFLHVYLSAIRP